MEIRARRMNGCSRCFRRVANPPQSTRSRVSEAKQRRRCRIVNGCCKFQQQREETRQNTPQNPLDHEMTASSIPPLCSISPSPRGISANEIKDPVLLLAAMKIGVAGNVKDRAVGSDGAVQSYRHAWIGAPFAGNCPCWRSARSSVSSASTCSSDSNTYAVGRTEATTMCPSGAVSINKELSLTPPTL